ncbi:MAG TPA: hypothetical protein VHF89_16010 [Solirubrobacteraceae bacterium]|nr:hypothetical protein [Solirubrobacteraceae bacterium]
MDAPKVPPQTAAEQLAELLDSPEIAALVCELEATRWTGPPGYPIRSMIGMALSKSLYAIPTWTRTVALVREHGARAATIAQDGDVPSVYACYRFTAKLRAHTAMLTQCIDRVTAGLRERIPELGRDVAIDASDMPPAPTASATCPRTDLSASATASPTRRGDTAPPSATRKGGGGSTPCATGSAGATARPHFS